MVNETSTQTGAVGLPVGTKIGKYEVRERSAIGGQSIVYKCYDALLDRYVAIKQISTHLAEDPKFLEKFRKEAQILARLGAHQPAIVTIHELIEDERGLFIVMEFIQGHSLETVLEDTRGPVEAKAVLQVLWRLASALHDVHTAGIIHRDIKPANIIIADGLRPKITDFGVAASSGDASMPLGTTKYMAPELYSGGTVDGRVDMYSLGLIAYEMLAGRPRFNEIFAEVIRDKHSEALRWMKWHGNPAVVAPPLHEVNPAVPQALSDIVAKMLTKDPKGRYENMEALGRAVKSGFSPRAKAPAGMDARVPRRQRARAALASSKILAGVAEAPAGAGLDEGDELELTPQTPVTAPIPKRKLSLRTKLVLAGSLFVVLAAAGATYLVLERQKENRRNREAAQAFLSAKKLYDDGSYKAAMDGFSAVRARFAGTPQAELAPVLVSMCSANLIVDEMNWGDPNSVKDMERAVGEQEKARAEAKRIQVAKRELLEDTRRILEDIDKFDDYRHVTQKFREVMADADKAFKDGKLDEAKTILIDRLTSTNLTVKQGEERSAFVHRIDYTKVSQAVSARAAEGDRLVKDDKLPDAQKEYQAVLAILKGEEAKILPADERRKIEGDVKTKLAQIDTEARYRAAVTGAEQAATNKEKIKFLREADRIRPAPELQKRIKALELAIKLDEAMDAVKGGRPGEAIARLTDYLKEDPENAQAKQALAELQGKGRQQTLVYEGDKLFRQGKFAEALVRFNDAAEVPGIPPEQTLSDKIRDCKYQIKLAEADGFRNAKEYVKAKAAYQEAAKIKSEAAEVLNARIAAMEQEQQYAKLLAEGDAALAVQQWPMAKKKFKEAQAVMNTAEIKDRNKMVVYKENIFLGTEALERGDPRGASGYFKIAQNQFDTPEIRELIAKAEKAVREKESIG